jgi:DNA-binding PadR family transcriptional regulator
VRAAVLALLAERPMHGYEIIGELAERTNGMWKPSPGSVYPTLQMLEEEGLVTGEEADGKRRFTLTDEGRAKAAAQPDNAPWEQVAQGVDPGLKELWDAFRQMAGACKQISSAGTSEQQARAVAIVTDARKKLYGILAED